MTSISFGQNTNEDEKDDSAIEARVKTLFIYNFIKYIEWPNSKDIKSFRIVVLGNEKLLTEELNNLAKKKLYKASIPFQIIQAQSELSIPDCEMIYMNVEENFDIDKVLETAINNNSLLVTEGYVYGESMINFVKVGHLLKFEASEDKFNLAKLKVSSKLLDLAIKNEKVWNDIISKMNHAINDNNIKITNEDLKKILKEYDKKNQAIKRQDSLIELKEILLNYKKIEIKEQEKAITQQKAAIYMKQQEFSELSKQYFNQNFKFNKQLKLLEEQQVEFEKKQKEIEAQELVLVDQKSKINSQKKELIITNEKIGIQSIEIKQKSTTIYVGLGILLLLIGFSFFIYKSYKDKKKSNILISKQKELVEEKNKEITDSIQYAKRIQHAILPPLKVVKEYLNESFILYKPKDIVAGDFYWLESVSSSRHSELDSESPNKEITGQASNDDIVLFAAADCTGHGVPGAMVSVVCNNGLNRSVREFGLTDPGEILNKTREIVIAEFEKSEDEVKDGMDIALCSLEGNVLKYAGANNPLWIIRNNEIIETKADKQPIGKFDELLPYTTHIFELQKGDSIYIFSDGYVDQFGGEKGKKFKAQAFRKLLLSIQEKSMEEQQTIINSAFEDWKGNLEQIDDVCIIGVKI